MENPINCSLVASVVNCSGAGHSRMGPMAYAESKT